MAKKPKTDDEKPSAVVLPMVKKPAKDYRDRIGRPELGDEWKVPDPTQIDQRE